jgi:hypothetical protein
MSTVWPGSARNSNDVRSKARVTAADCRVCRQTAGVSRGWWRAIPVACQHAAAEWRGNSLAAIHPQACNHVATAELRSSLQQSCYHVHAFGMSAMMHSSLTGRTQTTCRIWTGHQMAAHLPVAASTTQRCSIEDLLPCLHDLHGARVCPMQSRSSATWRSCVQVVWDAGSARGVLRLEGHRHFVQVAICLKKASRCRGY